MSLDESWYIELLLKNTPYKEIGIATETTLDMQRDGETKPRIVLAHETITPQDTSDFYTNLFQELDNEEVLITNIQVICPRKNWITVRQNIVNGFQGFSPFENDSDYSSIGAVSCTILASTSNKVWFSQLAATLLPRIS